MAKVRIYQINHDKDKNRVIFCSYKETSKLLNLKDGMIDSSIYDEVYECNLKDSIDLEDIYYIFNVEHPLDYKGRSLSVSDVVYIKDSHNVADGFYFVDSFGFKRVYM